MRELCGCVVLVCLVSDVAQAFCGTYVGGQGQVVRNQGSQIVVARHKDRTTLTMFNDFRGDPDDFALVVPVPDSIDGNHVRTIDGAFMNRLESYSSPREVAYTCHDFYRLPAEDTGLSWGRAPETSGGCSSRAPRGSTTDSAVPVNGWTDEDYGVVIEDHFDFGEYEAFVLSASDENGLMGWLDAHGFVLAAGVEEVLQEYLDGTFLAVRVEAGQVLSGQWLSPIQVDYTSPMVSLPIRLGALSSTGIQDLTLYTLSTEGRGAIVNYPEVRIPSECLRGGELPMSRWYEDAFAKATGLSMAPDGDQSGAAWVLEYGWHTPAGRRTATCDPCVEGASSLSVPSPSLQPLSVDDIAVLGLPEGLRKGFYTTRMHMRYTPDAIQQDLAVVTDTQLYDAHQLLWVAHLWELESVIDACGVAPENPGSCYASEYFLDRAEDRAAGRPVDGLSTPATCGKGGRAVLLLVLPLGVLGLRRRS